MFKLIIYIGRRFKTRNVILSSKGSIFKLLWNQVQEKFAVSALSKKHKRGQEITKHIDAIPEHIKMFVFKSYLARI